MFFCIFIALLSTIIWLQIVISEIVNSKNGTFDDASKNARLKLYLAVIMALFWAAVIFYTQ